MANGTDDGPPIKLAFGCLIFVVFIALLVVRSVGQNTSQPAAKAAPTPQATTAAPSNKRVGSTMLEQAIFDAFPTSPAKTKAERKTVQNAAAFVASTINAAGYLCAKPIEMQVAVPGQYGVSCLKYRGGGGRANYLIDASTGSVDEI